MRRQDLRISSPQNPKVKAAAALCKHRERQQTGLFIVEGAREIDRALASGYEVTQAFYCPEAMSPEGYALIGALRSKLTGPMFLEVGLDAFAKLAMREGADGVAVVAKQKPHALSGLHLGRAPLVMALEAVEKPGNLGALLRTADGAGADAVVVLEATVDVYNPNVIRSSLGTVFKVPVVACSTADFVAFCRRGGLGICAAALTDRAVDYAQVDYRGATALLLGSEAHGLSPALIAAADHVVKIPMLGIADSLNVAAAGAVLLYEARRQRSAPRAGDLISS